jgi:hypothetical protein
VHAHQVGPSIAFLGTAFLMCWAIPFVRPKGGCSDVALSVSVRCVCSLPVGRATLRLLVRSNGARCADALGFRRVSTSSESTGRLARLPVVSGRLRTTTVRCQIRQCDLTKVRVSLVLFVCPRGPSPRALPLTCWLERKRHTDRVAPLTQAGTRKPR